MNEKYLLADEEIEKYRHIFKYQIGDELSGLHTITEDDWDIAGLLKAQLAAVPAVEQAVKAERERIGTTILSMIDTAPYGSELGQIINWCKFHLKGGK